VHNRLAGVRDREENLKKAIEAFEEALRVYAFEKSPQDYAMTQNNLGNAYWGLAGVGARDKEKNLKKAIKAYEQAFRVYTFKEFPQYYATTQNNLGTACANLAEIRDREENLRKAIDAFGEALRVRKKETLPIPFAETSYNLAIALNIKGDRTDAIKVIKEILPVAKSAGDPSLEQYRKFYERLKSSQ
ncbi:MAG: tetratricopeptide repeat protein, partial [Candidatus Bathyanammoxibius sp.]